MNQLEKELAALRRLDPHERDQLGKSERSGIARRFRPAV